LYILRFILGTGAGFGSGRILPDPESESGNFGLSGLFPDSGFWAGSGTGSGPEIFQIRNPANFLAGFRIFKYANFCLIFRF
jgi:hypothetical protein